MENNLKNELSRIFKLMNYSYSNSKNFINEGDYTQKEKEESPFRIARVGGEKIRIEDPKTGDKINIDKNSIDDFIAELSKFKNNSPTV